MSDLNLKVFRGILSASAGVLTNLFDLISVPRIMANTYIERADHNYEIDTDSRRIDKVGMSLGILQMFAAYTYYYDEEIQDSDKKRKWLIYALITFVIVNAVLVLYWQYGKNRRVKRIVAGYVLPVLGLGVAGFSLVKVLSKNKLNDNDLGVAMLDVGNAVLGMWKFAPIKQSIASDPVDGPAIMYLVSGTRMALSGVKFALLPYKG